MWEARDRRGRSVEKGSRGEGGEGCMLGHRDEGDGRVDHGQEGSEGDRRQGGSGERDAVVPLCCE